MDIQPPKEEEDPMKRLVKRYMFKIYNNCESLPMVFEKIYREGYEDGVKESSRRNLSTYSLMSF